MITPIVIKQCHITSTPTSQDKQISPSRILSSDFNLVEDDFDIESDENNEKQLIPAPIFGSTPLSAIEEEKRKNNDTKFDEFDENHILTQNM